MDGCVGVAPASSAIPHAEVSIGINYGMSAHPSTCPFSLILG